MLCCLATGLVAGCSVLDNRLPAEKQNVAMPSNEFVIKADDTVASAFARLGTNDKSIYILAEGADIKLAGNSAPISSMTDLVAYLKAYGHEVAVSVKETPYIRVKVTRAHEQGLGTSKGATSSRGCAPLASIRVESAHFRDNSLPDVMDAMLAETGWSWHLVSQTAPKLKITATDISDTLDRVLPQLLEQVGMPYVVRDCRILIGKQTSTRSIN